MRQDPPGNLLMVANYPSDTAYAWWLMEHFWKTLAERFTQAGVEAYLAYPEITSLSDTIAQAPIKSVQLTIPWQSPEQATNVKKFLREKNISALYFTDQPYFNPQYGSMRLSGIQRIVIHDHTPGDRLPVRHLKGAIKAARNALPWFTADQVLCVSELMRQRNLANGRIPARKCAVVQNGIRAVACTADIRLSVRKRLGVQPNSVLVVTTGRAHPYKRFDFVIECASALRRAAPDLDITFLLAGDGPAMSELHAQVQRLELEDTVRLLGFRDDIRDLLCASDVAMHAALGEGFSLSIIEYMSASLPVLVPDIPSVSQAIRHNETGLVYPTEEIQAAADQILGLVTDGKRRLAMGQAAKAEADSRYSLERCTQYFIKAIESGYRI